MIAVFVEHGVAVCVIIVKCGDTAFVVACPLPHVEGTDGFAFDDALNLASLRETGEVKVGLIEDAGVEFGVGYAYNLILVVREVERGRPVPITCLDRYGVDGEFDTTVAHLAHIGNEVAYRIFGL